MEGYGRSIWKYISRKTGRSHTLTEDTEFLDVNSTVKVFKAGTKCRRTLMCEMVLELPEKEMSESVELQLKKFCFSYTGKREEEMQKMVENKDAIEKIIQKSFDFPIRLERLTFTKKFALRIMDENGKHRLYSTQPEVLDTARVAEQHIITR